MNKTGDNANQSMVKSNNEGGKNEPKEISYLPQELLSFKEVQELDHKYLMQNYARIPINFVYGSGEFLYDSDGKEYIDFISGIAVTAMGHAHADLIQALTAQAERVWHTSNLFYNQEQALLARALVEVSFPGKVLFCNSGTEANEAAFKLIRAWGQQNGGKTGVVAIKNGFHGRTWGAMSLTGQEKIQSGYGELVPGVTFVEANNIAELEAAVDNNTCGIIMEPIHGEGGVLPMTHEFLSKARKLADENKALLVFDEIQTGIGRTGSYFAFQEYGIKPDAVTMAKGLGGGFPIGAILIDEKYTGVFKSGMHGTTFGGNHLATAVGYEVLRLIESGKLLENVHAMGDYLKELLANIMSGYPDKVKEIRGMGLLIGIVLDEKVEARPLIEKGLEKGIIFGRAGSNVIRLAPPLNVRPQTIDKFCARLEEMIKEL